MSFAGRQLDRYHLIRLIGQGGTGEVYLAEDQRITRSVAIKLVRSDPFDSEDVQDTARLFIREAQTIAMFTHPHIQPLFDFGEENIDGVTFAYIVTAFCPDGSLDKWLEQRKGNPLLLLDVHALIQQAAEALDYAHEHGVIHRDVKPPNFLVQTRKHAPDRPDILLSDFGIARLTEGVQQASSVIRGTPIYMAPEQWVGTAVPATDQYALAVMTYRMLTNRPPFQGTHQQVMYKHIVEPPQPPSIFDPGISPAIDAVLLRALSKDPAARFPYVADFARAFQEASQNSRWHSTQVRETLSSPQVSSESLPRSITPVAFAHETPKLTPPPTMQHEVLNAMFSLGVPTGMREAQAATDVAMRPAKRRTLFIMGAILVLLVASISGFITFGVSWSASNAATATALAATSLAFQAHNTTATAVANIGATSTAQSNATADTTQDQYDSTLNNLVLSEALNKNTRSQWDEQPDKCSFSSDGYHVSSQSQNVGATCIANDTSFANFALQVQVSIIQGESGGLLLRNSNTSSYYFRIMQKGNYALLLCGSAGINCTKTLVSGFSSSISTGQKQINMLAVVAKGNHIALYVNGGYVDSVHNSASLSGRIGVSADAASEVVCSDAKVWTA